MKSWEECPWYRYTPRNKYDKYDVCTQGGNCLKGSCPIVQLWADHNLLKDGAVPKIIELEEKIVKLWQEIEKHSDLLYMHQLEIKVKKQGKEIESNKIMITALCSDSFALLKRTEALEEKKRC